MQAALGVSTLPDPQAAGREVAEMLGQRLGGGSPELVLLVATTAHGRGLPDLVDAARAVLPAPVVGASVEGVVAPGLEVSDYPAVLALGLAGHEARPFFLHDAAADADRAGEEIESRAGPLGRDDLVCLLIDSQSVDVARVAASLADRVADRVEGPAVLGTGAAATPRGRPLLWCGRERGSDAIAGFALPGVRPRVALAQAGRPVTPLLPVTRARGHWVTGLSGRPALDVYEEAASECGLRMGPGVPPPLLAGLASPAVEVGDLLVRNVVGLDPDRRAFSLPGPVTAGQALALVVLDPEAARADMSERFRAMAETEAAFGLYLNCRARGAALFGEPGVEATELANAFAKLPIAGISSPFQLAPLTAGATPAVVTYAGVLALAGPRE